MSINTAVFPQQGQPIPLGRQGESNARTIVFEIYGWLREYGEGGTFLLLHKRPNDQAAYLVPFTMSPNGTEIFWKVSAVDTDKDTSGSFGEAELRYEITSNGVTVKAKSELYRTMVAKSLGEYNPRYPDVPEPEGGGLILRPVLERPTIGDENVIYLVPNDASEDPENVYVEWIYVNDAWEEWGKYTADVDIASKADLSYVNAQLELKQDKISATGTDIKPVYFSSAGTATPIPGYVPDPSDDNPLVDGTASPGTSTDFSRKDHRHPHDSAKQDKLVATGSAVQGVYVSAAGEVSAMTHSLNKTVPANAVFTDTTYEPATSSMNGLMSATDKAKLDSISLPASGVSMPVILANQSVATFTSAAAGRPLRVTVNIEPQQAGSGDPSPSNVRPITGWSGVTISRTGKNLLKITAQSTSYYTINADGTISGVAPPAGAAATNIGTVSLKANVEYAIVGYVSNGFRVYISAEGNNYAPRGTPVAFTPSSDTTGAVSLVYTGAQSGLTIYPMLYKTSDPPSAYEGYRGHSVTVSLGGAGTVYGGTLDVARGLLTVTHGQIASYNGESIPDGWISSTGQLSTGAQVVYPLATPLTYLLTPQQIIALDGTNNILANCGPVAVAHWPGTGTPVELVEDASEIEWKKGILAKVDAWEAGG